MLDGREPRAESSIMRALDAVYRSASGVSCAGALLVVNQPCVEASVDR